MMAGLCCRACLAHYELDDDQSRWHAHHFHGHRSTKVKRATKSSTSPLYVGAMDPWKFLELAISPAQAMEANVSIGIEGQYRVLRANGIPNHQTGAFPNAGNPNTMSEQRYTFRMPVAPIQTGATTPLGMYPFGVALNGVPFDPGAAEWWENDPYCGWQYEAMSLGPRLGLDQNNAHVQPGGAYHYHGIPTGLLQRLPRNAPVQLGYAADGFPIYAQFGYSDAGNERSAVRNLRSSYRLKGGSRDGGPGGSHDGSFVQDYEYVKGLGDLDDCNGRFAVTPEYPHGTYHYVITENFPYIPRGFKGTPDMSFKTRGGSRPGPAGGPGFGRFGPGWPGGPAGFGGPPPYSHPGMGGQRGPGGMPPFHPGGNPPVRARPPFGNPGE